MIFLMRQKLYLVLALLHSFDKFVQDIFLADKYAGYFPFASGAINKLWLQNFLPLQATSGQRRMYTTSLIKALEYCYRIGMVPYIYQNAGRKLF